LNRHNQYFNYIIQAPFKDTIKITGKDTELIVDMYYDGDGFYSSIIATYYDEPTVWSLFKEILNKLKTNQ
jgi:hypothetical protein